MKHSIPLLEYNLTHKKTPDSTLEISNLLRELFLFPTHAHDPQTITRQRERSCDCCKMRFANLTSRLLTVANPSAHNGGLGARFWRTQFMADSRSANGDAIAFRSPSVYYDNSHNFTARTWRSFYMQRRKGERIKKTDFKILKERAAKLPHASRESRVHLPYL